VLTGCSDPRAILPGDIRVYRAPKEAVATSLPERPVAKPSKALAIRYEPPAGWTDRGASGMRLATLVIDGTANGHEVTVIPASGSLEANVARWLGQLDPAASPETLAERAAAALTAAERIPVGDVEASLVVLLADADSGSEATGEGILAGVIPLDDTASLFVKLKAPATVVQRELEPFRQFLGSIRRN
jgi:hypothetical protein